MAATFGAIGDQSSEFNVHHIPKKGKGVSIRSVTLMVTAALCPGTAALVFSVRRLLFFDCRYHFLFLDAPPLNSFVLISVAGRRNLLPTCVSDDFVGRVSFRFRLHGHIRTHPRLRGCSLPSALMYERLLTCLLFKCAQ